MRPLSPPVDRAANGDRTAIVLTPSPEADWEPARPAHSSPPAPAQHNVGSTPSAATSLPPQPPVVSAPVPLAPQYTGPRSGTLESNGSPIPQNAEFVFRNLPAVKIQLEYDTKIWDARLAPGE